MPDGHGVSVSDIYFVAHFCQRVNSLVGVATGFERSAVLVGRERTRLEADVLIRSIGFDINEGNERLLGRSHIRAGGQMDVGLWTIYEPHVDGVGGGFPITSYFDAVHFRIKLMPKPEARHPNYTILTKRVRNQMFVLHRQ